MTEYDGGVGFLDLDGMVVGNLDGAFEMLRLSNTSLASIPDQAGGYDQARASPQAGSMWAMPDRNIFQEMLAFKNDTSGYEIRYPEQLMLNRFFWGRWLCMPARYGLQVPFADREDWARLRKEAVFLHYTGGSKPWYTKEHHENIETEKVLWRENLAKAAARYKLTLADLTSHGLRLGWPVAEMAGLA